MNFKPWLESTEEQYSNEMTERLCSWIKLHGRKPKAGPAPILGGSPTAGTRVSYNVDLEENRLGEFLEEKIKSGRAYPSDLAILQRHGMEGLFEARKGSRREISLRNVEKLAEFYRRNGRYPSANDRDPELVYLITWLRGKRRSRRGLGKVIIYDGELELGIRLGLPEDWLDYDRNYENEEHNKTNIQKLAEYYKKNGHYPRKTDPDPEVKSLALWHQRKRRARRGPSSTKVYDGEKELGISLGLPEDWLDYFEPELNLERSRKNIQKIAEYYRKNGYYPRKTDPDPEVKSLATWLQHKRRATRGLGTLRVYDGEKELGISLGLPEDWLEEKRSKFY